MVLSKSNIPSDCGCGCGGSDSKNIHFNCNKLVSVDGSDKSIDIMVLNGFKLPYESMQTIRKVLKPSETIDIKSSGFIAFVEGNKTFHLSNTMSREMSIDIDVDFTVNEPTQTSYSITYDVTLENTTSFKGIGEFEVHLKNTATADKVPPTVPPVPPVPDKFVDHVTVKGINFELSFEMFENELNLVGVNATNTNVGTNYEITPRNNPYTYTYHAEEFITYDSRKSMSMIFGSLSSHYVLKNMNLENIDVDLWLID